MGAISDQYVIIYSECYSKLTQYTVNGK